MPAYNFRDSSSSRGRSRTRSSKPRKNLRSVSRRGAYAPRVKKQMMNLRNPIIENKSRIHSDVALANSHEIETRDDSEAENFEFLTQGDTQQPLNWRLIPNDDAFTLIPLTPFYRMQQGLKPYQMIGDTVMAKWLNTKIEVRFPQGEIFPKIHGDTTTLYRNMMIQENAKVYAIWGMITKAINAPLISVGGVAKPLDQWTQANILSYIQSELQPYFDNDYDKLSFRPKETTNIKIEKYVRLKPNLSETIAAPATPASGNGNSVTAISQATGSVPSIQKSHTFTFNRKVLYTEGYPAEQQSGEIDFQNLGPYQGDTHLPFLILYNPGFAAMDSVQHQTAGTKDPVSRVDFSETDERRTQNMFVRYNSQYIYSDS